MDASRGPGGAPSTGAPWGPSARRGRPPPFCPFARAPRLGVSPYTGGSGGGPTLRDGEHPEGRGAQRGAAGAHPPRSRARGRPSLWGRAVPCEGRALPAGGGQLRRRAAPPALMEEGRLRAASIIYLCDAHRKRRADSERPHLPRRGDVGTRGGGGGGYGDTAPDVGAAVGHGRGTAAQCHPWAMATMGVPPRAPHCAVPTAPTAQSGRPRGSRLVSANEAAPTATPSPQHGGSPPAAPPGPPYLSMMTGSDGVSLRFPQLFLSQQRLGMGGGGHEVGCEHSPHSAPRPQSPPAMGTGGPAP